MLRELNVIYLILFGVLFLNKETNKSKFHNILKLYYFEYFFSITIPFEKCLNSIGVNVVMNFVVTKLIM